MSIFDLRALAKGVGGLTPVHCAMLSECAAVCLDNRDHDQGVKLGLRGAFKSSHPLRWAPTTDSMRRTWAEMRETTGFGACAVAIAIVVNKTKYTTIDRSALGTGFDYWLGDQGASPDRLFERAARLEVSGILDGTESELDARTGVKTKQMQKSNRALPGFAIVVEFGTPKARVNKR